MPFDTRDLERYINERSRDARVNPYAPEPAFQQIDDNQRDRSSRIRSRRRSSGMSPGGLSDSQRELVDEAFDFEDIPYGTPVSNYYGMPSVSGIDVGSSEAQPPPPELLPGRVELDDDLPDLGLAPLASGLPDYLSSPITDVPLAYGAPDWLSGVNPNIVPESNQLNLRPTTEDYPDNFGFISVVDTATGDRKVGIMGNPGRGDFDYLERLRQNGQLDASKNPRDWRSDEDRGVDGFTSQFTPNGRVTASNSIRQLKQDDQDVMQAFNTAMMLGPEVDMELGQLLQPEMFSPQNPIVDEQSLTEQLPMDLYGAGFALSNTPEQDFEERYGIPPDEDPRLFALYRDDINDQVDPIAQQAYFKDLEKQAALEDRELANKGELDVQELRNKGNIEQQHIANEPVMANALARVMEAETEAEVERAKRDFEREKEERTNYIKELKDAEAEAEAARKELLDYAKLLPRDLMTKGLTPGDPRFNDALGFLEGESLLSAKRTIEAHGRAVNKIREIKARLKGGVRGGEAHD